MIKTPKGGKGANVEMGRGRRWGLKALCKYTVSRLRPLGDLASLAKRSSHLRANNALYGRTLLDAGFMRSVCFSQTRTVTSSGRLRTRNLLLCRNILTLMMSRPNRGQASPIFLISKCYRIFETWRPHRPAATREVTQVAGTAGFCSSRK